MPGAQRQQRDHVGHQLAHRNLAEPPEPALAAFGIEAANTAWSEYSGSCAAPPPARPKVNALRRGSSGCDASSGAVAMLLQDAAPRTSREQPEKKVSASAGALLVPRLRRRRMRSSAEIAVQAEPAARHITEIGSSQSASSACATMSGAAARAPRSRPRWSTTQSASASSASASSSASNPPARGRGSRRRDRRPAHASSIKSCERSAPRPEKSVCQRIRENLIDCAKARCKRAVNARLPSPLSTTSS